MRITDEEFNLMRDLIYERFGINLTEQKRSLLVGRLQKHLKSLGFDTVRDYHAHLTRTPDHEEMGVLVNLISTNHTYFNRENVHFDFFRNTLLPPLLSRLEREGTRDLRVWCAGCSTGEEAYTLLMLIRDALGTRYGEWKSGILATDISEKVLALARAGVYPEERVRQLPESLRKTYFESLRDGNLQVRQALKKDATFRRFNLMNLKFPFRKPFHVIFCRNVMIYFDQPTRDALVERFARVTEPGGYLFVGLSESLGRGNGHYRYVQPGVYRKEA